MQSSVNQSTSISSQATQVQVSPPQETSNDFDGNDPLAQTFIVSASHEVGATTDKLGVARSACRFLTSVDVFFSHKDETLPVWLEVHNVQNGFPGAKVLPFARKVLNPADITLTSDATTATKFTFDSPVYLQHETEYCIALMSTSPEFKVWIARMGETDIGGSRTISKQPHTGVLFKGHNNRTWAPSLTEDLKFVLNVAKFNTGSTGIVTLNNDDLPAKTLTENPLTFTNGNTSLLVSHKNHQMYATTNNVTISGVVSGATTTLVNAMTADATSCTLTSGTNFDDTTGKFAYDSTSAWYIKIDDEIMKYTTISSAAVSSITRGQDGTTAATHAAGATVELYMLHKVPFTEINKTHTSLTNINIDSYTVTLSSSPTITGGTTTASNGGTEVKATENASFDTANPFVATMEVPETEIKASIRPMTSTSPSGTQTSFQQTSASKAISINLNDNEEFDTPYMVASAINEQNENNAGKSLIIDCEMSSNNTDVTPVIDTGRMSFIAVGNKLNKIDTSADWYPTADFRASTGPDGDNNACIYLTIKAYYKILRTDDASEFDDLGYVGFNTDGSTDEATVSATTKGSFQQYVYTAGVTDDGVGSPLDEFISFQIKIVLQGTNTAEPPRIKELRCLALAM